MLEILNAHYNKSFDTNDTAKDVIFKAYAKTFDIFGFIKRDKIKSSTENLKRSLKISDKVLTIPILHRCNKCYKAWGIHFEMRHRLSNAPPIFNQSFDSIPFYLPKVNNFLNGLIFLNDNSEKTYINNHILDVKKMFINDKEIQLITAKKNIAMGNIGEALLNLGSFTNLPENRFFYNSVLQLQSRHSNCRQEKIKGTLSHQEETLELNKISSSTIALIDEINKYKNM